MELLSKKKFSTVCFCLHIEKIKFSVLIVLCPEMYKNKQKVGGLAGLLLAT